MTESARIIQDAYGSAHEMREAGGGRAEKAPVKAHQRDPKDRISSIEMIFELVMNPGPPADTEENNQQPVHRPGRPIPDALLASRYRGDSFSIHAAGQVRRAHSVFVFFF